MSLSRSFLAALLQRCRWLPCPPNVVVEEDVEYVDLPVVATAWNEELQVGATAKLQWYCFQQCLCWPNLILSLTLQQHLIVIGDVRCQTDTSEMVQLMPKLTVRHPGSSTDLQVSCTRC